MALNPIKIPSKHIYELSNQKVVDNQINKIIIEQKKPEIVYDTQNVFNQTLSKMFFMEDIAQHSEVAVASIAGAAGVMVTYIAYIEVTPIYASVGAVIPRNINNTRIINIITGKDENGNANIKYKVKGKISKGTANGYYNLDNAPNPVTVNAPTNVTLESEDYYNLDDLHELSYPVGSATATFTLTDNSTILEVTAKPTSDNKYYTLNFRVLCGLKINELGGIGSSTEAQLQGDYIEYSPTNVDVSYYGITISLDLQENTLTIGDGVDVYSFDSNELMQTTNSPTVEETYGKILYEYKNGKELATIRCGIEDYYDTDGKLAVSKKGGYFYNNPIEVSLYGNFSVEQTSYNIIVYADNNLGVVDKIYYNDEEATVKNLVYQNNNRWIGTATVIANGVFANLSRTGERVIAYKEQNKYPMLFNLGDTVIPYVYGANHTDKPMSYYFDNSPKEFNVVKQEVIYDGAIWQELSLQEVTKDNGIEALIYIAENEVIEGGGTSVFLEAHLLGGKLQSGNELIYKGEEALVRRYSAADNYWILSCTPNSIFDQNRGRVIWVTIKQSKSESVTAQKE